MLLELRTAAEWLTSCLKSVRLHASWPEIMGADEQVNAAQWHSLAERD